MPLPPRRSTARALTPPPPAAHCPSDRKLQALTIEIAQLQKQMNVARGEQSILAQQQKDTAKRVDIVSSTVSELSAEIVGDESAPSVAAVQGAAY